MAKDKLYLKERTVIKVDLHVHSKYSEHPSEWFLQRIGASESYTDPEFIYRAAKENGMSFVTITDHNKIEGVMRLKERHPEDVFTGLETTAYFPENGCKVHILIYGLGYTEYDEIQKIRKDIYQLRDYIKEKNLAYSVAHAMYSVNDRLSIEHLEKLILLFDNFEGINGARNKLNNNIWIKTLESLNPEKIGDLFKKHGLEPFGNMPWIKGLSGGSDDHGGIFIGKTYTMAEANNLQEFLDKIKSNKISADGRHNDFKSLAFALYKIAYDFSKSKSNNFSKSFISKLSSLFFENNALSFKDRLKIKKMKYSYKKGDDNVRDLITELIEEFRANNSLPIENKLDLIYSKIASIADEFARIFIKSIETDLQRGDVINLIKNISTSLPGIFISIPFFSTFRHLFQSRDLSEELKTRFNINKNKAKKILWFTDDSDFANTGFLKSLDESAALHHKNRDVKFVSCNIKTGKDVKVRQNIVNIPGIYSLELPWNKKTVFHIPSVLKSLQEVYEYDPDEIYISGSGPICLFGLFAAKLLNTKAVAVYDSDYSWDNNDLIEDDTISGIIDSYFKWFYSCMDTIKVLKKEHLNIFQQWNFEPNKIVFVKSNVKLSLYSAGDSRILEKDSSINLKERFDMDIFVKNLFDDEVNIDKRMYNRILHQRFSGY
ncbi:MAG: glycosyl transferase family 1 [Elusimicrobia bacterium]|nr:glycosyl transferase family 1 [Candidatus Liberimonas magnetica]